MKERKPGRPSNSLAKKSEILEKAAACFTFNGYNKTTLDKIGEALGFNKAALYYYFTNKEDLFRGVIINELGKLWERMTFTTNAAEGLNNKMFAYFDTRTDGWISIYKINGFSKENLMNLSHVFSDSILSFRKSEVEFLQKIFNDENKPADQSKRIESIKTLLEIQSQVTMSAMLMRDMANNPSVLKETKAKKNLLLKLFINDIISDK